MRGIMARSIKAKATPALLAWARNTAGLSLDDAAGKLGKKFRSERLALWEAGDDHPTIVQLRKMSEIYRRPLAVFYLPSPPYDFPVPHDFRRLPEQGPASYSPRLRLELRLAHERRQTAFFLLEELDEQPKKFTLRAELLDAAEIVGARARAALNIPMDEQMRWNDAHLAFRSWRAGIENLGVLVFQVSGVDPTEMRGFSIAEETLPIIAVNRSGRESPRARSFSLMHELTHLMLRVSSVCDFDDETPRSKRDLQTEAFCNRVAAAILVPAAHFVLQPEIAAHPAKPREWPEEIIGILAGRYSVSREVIVRKLLIEGRASAGFYRRKRDEYRNQYREWRKAQKGGFEDHGEKRVRLLGPSFTRLVLENYYNGKMTLSEALGHLGTKVKHLPTIEQTLKAA